MTLIKLYESSWSDGYAPHGDGKFWHTEYEALNDSKARYGSGATSPRIHDAIENETGRFYLLKSKKPVATVGSDQYFEDKRLAALAKLTPEELKLLNLL